MHIVVAIKSIEIYIIYIEFILFYIFLDAFHQKFPSTAAENFDKVAMRHFQYAKDRMTKKKYVRKGSPQRESQTSESKTTAGK